MKKSFQKLISVVLVALMLVTPLSSGIFALAASVTVPKTDDVVIAVPETIYMIPNGGESVSGQYFVNNIVENGGSITLSAESAQTLGSIGIYAPGSTAMSFTATTVTNGIGEAVMGGTNTNAYNSYENTRWEHSAIYDAYGTGAAQDWFRFDLLNCFISGKGIAPGNTALVEWAVTVYYGDSDTTGVTYYAYTTLYSPHRSVGAVSESRRSGSYNNEISSWITGINGISNGTTSPIASSRGSKLTQGYFKNDPLWTGHPGGGSSESSDDYVSASATEKYVVAQGTDGAEWSRAVGYVGYITVDSSRYTNTNQIPNFKIGSDALRVTGENKDSLRQYYAWYVLGDSSKTIGGNENSTPSGWTQFVNKSEPQTTSRDTLVPAFDVSTINGLYIHVANQGSCYYLSDPNYANTAVSAQFTTVNKAELRKLVLQGSTLNSKNYTNETWSAYKKALQDAAFALGNPSNSSINTSALTAAINALKTNISVDLDRGTLAGEIPSTITIGAGSSVKISDIITTPPTRTGHTFLGWARRSDLSTVDKNLVVSFNEEIQAVWQANNYALLYDNLFSTVDFSKSAGMTANRAGATVTYDKTANAITVKTNNVSNTDVSTNVGLGGNYYNIAVQGSTEYIFEYDVETDVRAQVHLFFYNSAAGSAWLQPSARSYTYTRANGTVVNGTYPDGDSNNFMWMYTNDEDNGHYVLKFRTPANADMMSFRFGNCNEQNVTSTFSNIRLIDAANYYEDVNYTENAKVYTYQDGAKYGTLFEPERTAYKFDGWFTLPNGGTPVDSNTVNADRSTVLYSKWTPVLYTIKFNTDGGSNVADFTYTYEDTGNLPTPYKPGYAFDGWLVETAGGNWQAGKTYYSIDKNYGNVTLKANFVDPGYQINLSFADDEINNGIKNYNYNYYRDFIFEESMLPAKHGYKFTGWQVIGSDSTDWVVGTQFMLTGNQVIIPKGKEGSVTLKPMWEIVQYNISFNTDGGENIASAPYYITSEITLPEPKKAGYNFAGWTVSTIDGNWTESYSAGQVLKEMYGNVTLKANWVANGYVVIFNPNGGEVNPDSISYDITGSISIPTPTRTGYVFNNWKVEASVGNWSGTVNGGELLREKYGNVTLVAQWTPVTYTIIYDTQGEEITPTLYSIETEINIPASVRNGFTFTGWTVKLPDGNWTQEDTINPGKLNAGKYGNVTLIASFTENTYTVTFNDENTANITYKISERITIPELVKAGYTFKGWEVVASSGSWTKGTIINHGSLPNGRYGDVTLNPVFTPNNYKITFVPDGGIMDSDTLAYTPDDLTALPTPTKTGYNFIGWKVTAPAGSWNADAVIPGGTSLEGKYGDVTLTAQWEAQTFEIKWVDGNGNTLKTEQIEYGETPAYTGATPTKAATAQYTYTFNNTWSPAVVPVTENATYTAQFEATVNKYTVTWKYEKDANGTIETVTEEYKYGEYPVFNNGAIPQKESAPGSSLVFRFTGWTPTVATVTGNVTYEAQFDEVNATAKVTWVIDGNGHETLWAEGETPEYPGTPTKPDSDGYKYTFSGWTPEIQEITDPNGEYTYTANFTKTAKEYTVKYILNGGSGDESAEYPYTNEDDQFPWIITNKSGYKFTGWKLVKVDTEESYGWAELGTIYNNSDSVEGNWGNVTFEAQWEPIEYAITVYSTNEKLMSYTIESIDNLPELTKDGYVLSGWIIVSADSVGNWTEGDIVAADKTLAGMYGNVTVEPMWSAMPYKLTLISGEYTQVIEIKYGDIVDEYYPVAKPGYTAKWDKDLPEIMPKEDVTLTAEYEPIQYFLNFDVAGGNKVNGFYYDITSDQTIPVPTHPGAEFIQWVVADGNGSWYKGMQVGGNEALKGHYGSATLTAQWKLKSYTVKWVTGDTERVTQWYYGAIPSFDGTPYKAPDADNSYEFIGWDKEITEVTGDVTYIAQFEAVERTYTVKWKIDNYIVEENYQLGDMPVYKGEIPTRPATNEYEFVFTGWSPSIEAVDSDITYTAQFQTNIKLLGIRIDKTTVFMNVGDKDVLRAILSPATATNKDIIWSSSDESVVTIDENGNLEAVGAGISVICVQSANGKVRAYSVVSVAPVINQYVIVSAGGISTTRLSGQSIQLTATLMPDNEIIKNVTWTSSNPDVAIVEPSGLVIYGLIPGTAVITATVDGYIAGSIEVTTTDNSGDIVDRVKTYVVSFNASTSQYIIGDVVYDNISIVYAEGDTVEFLLTEPHFAMANGVQLERDTDGVYRIENIQQNYLISTSTRADIGFEDDSEDEAPKLSFFDKLKAFFQTIIDFFRNLFR